MVDEWYVAGQSVVDVEHFRSFIAPAHIDSETKRKHTIAPIRYCEQ